MGAIQRIVDELRRRGVTVHEWPGWQSRGNGTTDLNVKGIILHHTGSAYGFAYPELVESSQAWADGGALCNFAGNEDGSLTVIAAGLAYHAGGGYGPNQGPLAPYANNRNYYTVGLEIVYPGSKAMRQAQYDTAVALSRVVVDLFAGGNAEYARAHAEVNGIGYEGKWDPGRGVGTEFIDMGAFRNAVWNWTPPRPPLKIKDKYMKLIKGDERPEVWIFEFGVAGIVKSHIPNEFILNVWQTLLGKTEDDGTVTLAPIESKPQAYVDLITTYTG